MKYCDLFLRKLFVVLIILSLVCLTACSGKTGEEDTSIEKPQSSSTEQTEESEEEVRILDLDKTVYADGEWAEDAVVLLVRTGSEQVRLEKEFAKDYPELAMALEELASMQKSNMEVNFDNLAGFAKEKFSENPDNFTTYVSTSNVYVRRSDSVAVSILEDSFYEYGDLRGRLMEGSNYDTKTGQKLELSDVIKDMSKIPELVMEGINSEMWMTNEFNEDVIKAYFENTPEDMLSWTLDYNGVTFYFEQDILWEYSPMGCATVQFEGNEELFHEKYMKVAKSYMVEMPVDAAFFSDLNNDNRLDELNFTQTLGEEFEFEYGGSSPHYASFSIFTDIDTFYYYEDMFAYNFHPYFVKTSDGKHYLYLFAEQYDIQNRLMDLHVYELKTGEITKIGSMNTGPYYKPDNSTWTDIFALPMNPENFYMDDFSEESLKYEFSEEGNYNTPDPIAYTVGVDGMPVKK